MDPIDLFVAYVVLSSVLAWCSVVLGPSAMILRLWRWKRAVALADREALELLAGRVLPGAGCGGARAPLEGVDRRAQRRS